MLRAGRQLRDRGRPGVVGRSRRLRSRLRPAVRRRGRRRSRRRVSSAAGGALGRRRLSASAVVLDQSSPGRRWPALPGLLAVIGCRRSAGRRRPRRAVAPGCRCRASLRRSVASAGGAAAVALGSLSTLSAAIDSRIQTAATTIVIRVNRSPALVPNALWPPIPPKRAGQAAAAAALHEDHQHQKDREQRQRNAEQRSAASSSANSKHARCSTPRPQRVTSVLRWAAATIAKKPSAFSDAPPTSAPSMFGWPSSVAAFSAFTLPPYWIRTLAATCGL